MKIIISPAKSLDFENKATTTQYSQPRFLEQSEKLSKKLKTLSRKKLGELMKISDDLSSLNYDRNQQWKPPFSIDNAKQAIYSFTGEVFRGIDVTTLSEDKIPTLQNKLRILSGLYGLLKPLDLIQPYRLEMGTKLKVGRTENLYKFWADKLAAHFKAEIDPKELLVNLASQEYFKAIYSAKVKNPVLNIEFKDFSNGSYKVLGFFAKRARGLMANYIIQNRITSPEEIRSFNINGYYFDESSSNEFHYIFLRESKDN